MPSKAKWTVLTYIAAHNNLDVFGKTSLREILGIGSTAEVVQGALFDGTGGAGRYVMGEPGFVDRQEKLGEVDSGDPGNVIGTAKWLFARHPAERYGLVLWSHGSGWEPSEIDVVTREARPSASADAAESQERSDAPGGHALFRTTLRALLTPDRPTERAILFDDGTGHSLDTLELGRVTGTIAEAIGQPLELLGMDACLMANLEVAYEIRKAVRYFVASEELVPGHSWPYQAIYEALRADPDQDGAVFARRVVEEYLSHYTAHPPPGGDVTKVALDLGRIEALTDATDRLAEALRADMSAAADLLWQAQRTTKQQETQDGKRRSSKFNYHLWDIGSLAAALAGSDGVSKRVKEAAHATVRSLRPGAGSVIAKGHRGDWFDGIGGVSAYLMPPGQQRISPHYADLAFAKDTQWDEMLAAYHDQLV